VTELQQPGCSLRSSYVALNTWHSLLGVENKCTARPSRASTFENSVARVANGEDLRVLRTRYFVRRAATEALHGHRAQRASGSFAVMVRLRRESWGGRVSVVCTTLPSRVERSGQPVFSNTASIALFSLSVSASNMPMP